MAEFTTIETQEQLDGVISARLTREKEKHASEIAKLNERITSLTNEAEKYKGFETEKAQMMAKISKYETDSAKTAIADEYGLPKGFFERLKGDNEDAWRADAQELAKVVSAKRTVEPLANPERTETNDYEAALRALIKNM